MIEMSADIGKLAAALNKAQGEMGSAMKDAANPHFRSKYATLEAVVEVAKPSLVKHGIAYTQAPGAIVDGSLEMTTMLMHGESGQWIRSTLHVPLGKRDAQGVGSAISYARRYSLMSVLGIPAEDDDGAAAVEPPRQQKAQKQEKPAAPAPDNPFADEATDWKQESRDLADVVRRLKSAEEVDELWKTERVKAFRQGAGEALVLALRAVLSERKRALMPAQEVA